MEGPERRESAGSIKQTASISEQLERTMQMEKWGWRRLCLHDLISYPHFSGDETEVRAN